MRGENPSAFHWVLNGQNLALIRRTCTARQYKNSYCCSHNCFLSPNDLFGTRSLQYIINYNILLTPNVSNVMSK